MLRHLISNFIDGFLKLLINKSSAYHSDTIFRTRVVTEIIKNFQASTKDSKEQGKTFHAGPITINCLFSLPFLLRSIAASRRTSNSPFGNTGTTHRGLYSKQNKPPVFQLCFLKTKNPCPFVMPKPRQVRTYIFKGPGERSIKKKKSPLIQASFFLQL